MISQNQKPQGGSSNSLHAPPVGLNGGSCGFHLEPTYKRTPKNNGVFIYVGTRQNPHKPPIAFTGPLSCEIAVTMPPENTPDGAKNLNTKPVLGRGYTKKPEHETGGHHART